MEGAHSNFFETRIRFKFGSVISWRKITSSQTFYRLVKCNFAIRIGCNRTLHLPLLGVEKPVPIDHSRLESTQSRKRLMEIELTGI